MSQSQQCQYKAIESQQTYILRQKILRAHQAIEEMAYPNDDHPEAYHVAAFLADQIVGIASIYPESQSGELKQGDWRIRGMAVEEGLRGLNIGQQLVSKCIEHAKSLNGVQVWCNARSSAIGFYLSLNFEKQGDEFEIKGIGPHYIARFKL